MPRTRFILIRHGETHWNVEEREMGQLDSPLTVRGIAQAQSLAGRLLPVSFTTIYSSDLPRAVGTAQIIAKEKSMPVHFDLRLRERNMGIFQGLTVAEMHEMYPSEKAEYSRIGFTYVIPGGESAKQRLDRTVLCLNEIGEKHPNETVLCVTHGGILMGFFQYVLGMDPMSGARFKRQNAAINIFEKNNEKWVLETWGDTSHTERLGNLDDPHAQEN
jgi:2,3-bisphosphoglycerate-dependent phosphoglycerate mutase